jgi:hypothetical protein
MDRAPRVAFEPDRTPRPDIMRLRFSQLGVRHGKSLENMNP